MARLPAGLHGRGEGGAGGGGTRPAGGPDSPAARWFRRDPTSGEYATFEGHHELVALDHEEPEVLNYVAQVMTHWLDRGAAGWRLDAAYAVPLSFWSKVLARVGASHPGAWFLGEVIRGDYAAYASDGGLGFTVAETPDPGTRPDDPALVPAHSWVILGS